MTQPKLDRSVLYGDPIQLICRGRLSRPTFQALLVSFYNLERGSMLELLDLREINSKKDKDF